MTQPHEPPLYFERQIGLDLLNPERIGCATVADWVQSTLGVRGPDALQGADEVIDAGLLDPELGSALVHGTLDVYLDASSRRNELIGAIP